MRDKKRLDANDSVDLGSSEFETEDHPDSTRPSEDLGMASHEPLPPFDPNDARFPNAIHLHRPLT